MLFGLFERQQYWRVQDIERKTLQPLAWLREVLGGIAELQKRGPQGGAYCLKQHLLPAPPPPQQ